MFSESAKKYPPDPRKERISKRYLEMLAAFSAGQVVAYLSVYEGFPQYTDLIAQTQYKLELLEREKAVTPNFFLRLAIAIEKASEQTRSQNDLLQ